MPLPQVQVPQTNFLQMALMANQIKANKAQQNALEQQRTYEEEKRGWERDDRNYTLKKREEEDQTRKYQIESQAISTALKAPNAEEANRIYKALGGTASGGITIAGKDVSIDYGNSKFTGPANIVSELVENIGQNPAYMKNPQTWAWFTKNGGSIDQEQAKPPQSRTIQRGMESVTQEWDGEKFVDVAKGPKYKDPTGMMIETADGTVIRTGVPAGDEITKATRNRVEEKLLNTGNALYRLQSIQDAFDSDMQTVGGRVNYEAIKIKEKLGQDLSPEESEAIKKGSDHYVAAFSHLNATLSELSGAAVNEHEDKRLRAQMPNPGQEGVLGIMSGDSKTQFKQKIDKAIQLQKLALARYNYIRNRGFKIAKGKDGKPLKFMDGSGKSIELDDIPALMNERGAEIMSKIKSQQPGITDDQAAAMTEKRLAMEFGLVQ